jgi:16S rRNA U516 pseudouridylate synthase RsuA-like enzyme
MARSARDDRGRKREVRVCSAVGLPVTRLVRLRVGPIRLDGLEPGALRTLDRGEVQALAAVAGR